MNRIRSIPPCALFALAVGFPASPALAQTAPARGGSLAAYEAGYANGRQMEGRGYAQSAPGGTGNRLIVNGIIQTDSSAYFAADGAGAGQTASGADYFSAGAGAGGGATTAIGNLLTVSVDGSWNTVIVNSSQTNTGAITTSGATRR